jgi:peptidoglycan/LPS O-acetylase OafA/YrhL
LKHISDKPNHRIVALDGVRGIAILLVVLHHAFHLKLLWMGVDIFFVLSGFLITQVLLRKRDSSFRSYIGHFYLRRVQRILPAYLVCLLISALLYGSFWLKHWYLYFGAMNFLLPLQLPFVIFLPLWSLAVEEQFYLLWPLAVFFLPRRRMVQFSIALLILAPVLRYVCTPYFNSPWAIYMLLPFRMDCMAAGGLIAFLWPEIKARIELSPDVRTYFQIGAISLAIVSLIVILTLNHFGVSTWSNSQFGNLTIYETTLGLSVSVIFTALLGYLPRLFAWKPLTALATISYSIYLFHLMFLERLQTYLGVGPGTIAGIFATLLVATVSWFMLEKPILNWGKRNGRSV